MNTDSSWLRLFAVFYCYVKHVKWKFRFANSLLIWDRCMYRMRPDIWFYVVAHVLALPTSKRYSPIILGPLLLIGLSLWKVGMREFDGLLTLLAQ